MNRSPVISSNVASVGYDPSTMTLEVEFKKGGVYQYFNVPPAVHAAMVIAPSVGRYLDVNIKKAGYAVKKVSN
jgi:hypothetical protein